LHRGENHFLRGTDIGRRRLIHYRSGTSMKTPGEHRVQGVCHV
jgi:hypothetical protein